MDYQTLITYGSFYSLDLTMDAPSFVAWTEENFEYVQYNPRKSINRYGLSVTSLDGGVTLNSITEVQNCEWTGSSYRCGQSSLGGGARDTYTNTIKILDENNNVLSITTFTRNNDAGYYGNTHTYTDTATHTGTGARNFNWEWKGTDGSNTSHTSSCLLYTSPSPRD